jgi:hypothetical protein
MGRASRIKACELAAQCMQGHGLAFDGIGARLMSLCIFFEHYIDLGADATETDMQILSRRKVKKYKVVAGGQL